MAQLATTSMTSLWTPDNATPCTILVETGVDGLLAHLGHRLCLRVHDYRVELRRGHVSALMRSDSLRVEGVLREGQCATGVLSRRDVEKIEALLRSDILTSARWSDIRYEALVTSHDDPGSLTCAGDLTLRGVTRPMALCGRLSAERATLSGSLAQSAWGITPYSALAGQLRVADTITVRIEAALPRERAR